MGFSPILPFKICVTWSMSQPLWVLDASSVRVGWLNKPPSLTSVWVPTETCITAIKDCANVSYYFFFIKVLFHSVTSVPFTPLLLYRTKNKIVLFELLGKQGGPEPSSPLITVKTKQWLWQHFNPMMCVEAPGTWQGTAVQSHPWGDCWTLWIVNRNSPSFAREVMTP